VTALAESMQRLGQLQPISVCSSDSTIVLVAGLHRLEAAKRLAWEDIEAVFVTGDEIDRELQEIAENLHRADLSALERDEQIAKWLGLVGGKRVQPEQVSAGGRGNKGGEAQASRELGLSRADVHRAGKVAAISPKAKEAAREAGLDDNRTALLAAAKEKTADAQVGVIEGIAASKLQDSKLAEKKIKEAARRAETRKFATWIIARSKPGDIAKIATWLKSTKPDEVIAVIREMQR
jgi:ParB family transcriptional regulator, chromosome partitioning protein